METQTEKPKKIYLVWNEEDDISYFEQYDSLEDAVCSRGGKAEVYIASVKKLGVFKKAQKIIRVKQRKRKTNG